MSNRFHNKYHRHNHHTVSINDPRYPDASHDPIASADSPFLGDFVMLGGLSSTQEELTGFAGSFVHTAGGVAVNIESSTTAIQTIGDVNIDGDITFSEVYITGNIYQTLQDPVTATNEFLLLRIKNPSTGQYMNRSVRLWSSDTNV